MNYSYEILKALPKNEFLSVVYRAENHEDFYRNFNPKDWSESAITTLIEGGAVSAVEFWERSAAHPETANISTTGSGVAEAPVIQEIDWSHSPTIEEQPEFDPFTQTIQLNEIEDPMQETVGWTIIELTTEEQAVAREQIIHNLKFKRNTLLEETDWMMFADTPEISQAWLDYRQALRDVPAQAGFPETVVWPTKPEEYAL